MIRRSLIPAVLSILLLLAPPNEAAQNELNYEILSFRVPGIIILSGAADLNGDGHVDFLLFNKPSKKSRDKFCTVYLQKDGKLETKPDFEIHLGESVGGIQAEDMDNDGKEELLAFDGGGVVLYKLTASDAIKSQRILSSHSILPPSSRYLAPVNWIVDLTADGKKDILLPVSNGMRLFAQNEEFGFSEAQTFEFPVNGSLRQEGAEHFLTFRIPAISVSDYNADGWNDLGAFDLEEMNYFLSDGSAALRNHKTASLLREFTKDFVSATSFLDLNADGIPDAVLVLMSQKKNLESEVQIYFGKEGFTYGNGPDQVFSADSSLMVPIFLDATGDGKMEMLLQDINVGFGFFINYFVRNRIRVDTQLKKIGKNGLYEDEPVVRRAFYIQASEEGSEPARAAGDFNGDGLADLVVGTAENRLSFFLTNKTDILPAHPSAEFDVPAYGTMSLLNLNSDNRADFVITYPDKDKENLAVVFRSK